MTRLLTIALQNHRRLINQSSVKLLDSFSCTFVSLTSRPVKLLYQWLLTRNGQKTVELSSKAITSRVPLLMFRSTEHCSLTLVHICVTKRLINHSCKTRKIDSHEKHFIEITDTCQLGSQSGNHSIHRS